MAEPEDIKNGLPMRPGLAGYSWKYLMISVLFIKRVMHEMQIMKNRPIRAKLGSTLGLTAYAICAPVLCMLEVSYYVNGSSRTSRIRPTNRLYTTGWRYRLLPASPAALLHSVAG